MSQLFSHNLAGATRVYIALRYVEVSYKYVAKRFDPAQDVDRLLSFCYDHNIPVKAHKALAKEIRESQVSDEEVNEYNLNHQIPESVEKLVDSLLVPSTVLQDATSYAAAGDYDNAYTALHLAWRNGHNPAGKVYSIFRSLGDMMETVYFGWIADVQLTIARDFPASIQEGSEGDNLDINGLEADGLAFVTVLSVASATEFIAQQVSADSSGYAFHMLSA